jgi:site-specific DNA recombinase
VSASARCAPSSCVSRASDGDAYRSRKRTAWGQQRQVGRPTTEWIHHANAALEIVDPALWAAAHARLSASRASYIRSTGGQLGGRPANGLESKYLLTGLASCGVCGGGSLIVRSRVSAGRRLHGYTCSYHYLRGTAVCGNAQVLALEPTNAEVLAVLRERILTPEAIAGTVQKTLDRLRPSTEAVGAQRAALERELGALDQELGRLATALATGGPLTTLLAAIQTRETRREAVRQELGLFGGCRRAHRRRRRVAHR